MIEQGFPAFGAAPWLPHSFTTTPLAQPARQRRHRNAQRRRPQRCASSSRRTLAPSYASIRVSDSTTQRDLRHAICGMRMHVGHRDRIRFAHHASRMSDRRMRSVSAMRCDAFVSSPRARSAHRMRERASEIRARCRIHASFFRHAWRWSRVVARDDAEYAHRSRTSARCVSAWHCKPP